MIQPPRPPDWKNVPLFVTIRGPGASTGKSVLQFRLARFLSLEGYAVSLSDGAVGRNVLKNQIAAERMGSLCRIHSQPVLIHVSKELATNVAQIIGGCPVDVGEPIWWPKDPN